MSDYDSMYYTRFTVKSEFDKAIHTLEGIMKGISIDNKINIQELNELSAWCKNNYRFIDKQPYKELIPYIDDAISDNYLDQDEYENILWFCKRFKAEDTFFDYISSDIQRLHGILHGILADNKITKEEIVNLEKWLDNNTHLSESFPYCEIYSVLLDVLSDGIIDDEEEKFLKVLFSQYIKPAKGGSINVEEIEEYKKTITLSGVCAVTPEILFDGKIFCFTGKSSKSKRSDIISQVEDHNGQYINSVSSKTNYLIVGDNGNSCWAYACYGRKVDRAMNLRKKGCSIVIAHENDFWDAIEDLAL